LQVQQVRKAEADAATRRREEEILAVNRAAQEKMAVAEQMAAEAAQLLEQEARMKKAKQLGWAAVAVAGAEKLQREAEVAQQAKMVVSPRPSEETTADSSEDEGQLMPHPEEERAKEEDPAALASMSQNEWLAIAIRGAEAQQRALDAKREADAAMEAAKAKAQEAAKLEQEAELELEQLSKLQGRWSMWWSSCNPNTGIPRAPPLVTLVAQRGFIHAARA